MAGISIGSLILIVILAILIFGSKKIRSLGTDVGQAVKGFKEGMKDIDEEKQKAEHIVSSDSKSTPKDKNQNKTKDTKST